MKSLRQNKEPALFFGLTFLLSWALWIPAAALARGMTLPPAVEDFLSGPYNPAAFAPSLAAFLLTLLRQGWQGMFALLKRGVDFSFRKIWLAPILFLPLLIFAGAILLSIWIGATEADFSLLSNPPFALIGFVVILITAGPLQEEFGWRGYALPRLQARYHALTSSLILGFLWWLWHLPLVFIPGRFMADNLLLFGALFIEVELTSILFTWIFNHTHGSVLAAMLLHTAMNWSIWVVLPSMKTNLAIIGFTSLLLGVVAGFIFHKLEKPKIIFINDRIELVR